MTRIGEIVVNAGLVSAAGLEEALSAQAIHGGRLGTNLVELGLLNEEQLANALGKQHGLAFAFGEIHPDPSALKLVNAEFADEKDVIPLSTEGRTLHLLVVNPRDIEAIDRVAEVTGLRVVLTVIPELRMAQLLRRYCNAWRPMRAVDVMHAATGTPSGESASQPAQDLMGEEEFQTLYARAITGGAEASLPEAEIVGEADDVPAAPSAQPVIAIEDILASAPPADDSALPIIQGAPVQGAPQPASPTGVERRARPRRPKALVAADETPISFAEAQARLAKTADRDEIARIVLQFALGVFKRAVLLRVQGNIALGWHGAGPSARERAPFVAVPLQKSSQFKLVFDTRSQFIGPLRRDAPTRAYFTVLRMEEPKTAVLMPILAGGRVVNILYGDNGPGQFASPNVAEVLIVSQHVGRSYERLIASRKRS